MNLRSSRSEAWRFLFRVAMKFRRFLPKKRTHAFGSLNATGYPRIEQIYVINLDRQPARWSEMKAELNQVLDCSGSELLKITERYAAIDALQFLQEPIKDLDIDPVYTLGEQLFVEPQPSVAPDRFELDLPIQMSRPEIAVARSHIDVWRRVAESNHRYSLILEDDVWFHSRFTTHLNRAWNEIVFGDNRLSDFDLLYLSYEEAKHGAPKTFLSHNVFRPVRGLWHLSGYVLSSDGAQKLLRLLPCRGPIDLWINHLFGVLDVRAIRRSIINQRRDVSSTNSYSILPTLTRIGTITSEAAALFNIRPTERPVFAFGPEGSGLSSLAMALSMLGYRCCNDLQTLPDLELKMLLSGESDRVFDAYVNIGCLVKEARALKERYPRAKFIVTSCQPDGSDGDYLKIVDALHGADVVDLPMHAINKWRVVCEHLRCAPPACTFPDFPDRGERPLLGQTGDERANRSSVIPTRDKSPWIVESRRGWHGIHSVPVEGPSAVTTTPVKVSDDLVFLDTRNWIARDDTFTDNLALFRPSNIEFDSSLGATFSIKRESLGVRAYSAASLTSCDQYLFGKFEAVLKVSKVPGVITGFFLHRNSPRQEIDIEISGNRPDRLLVNVFFNPGGDGARFDYGYRGAASYIDLGFDASESYHQYAIEWSPGEIRWFVDNQLVHRRVEWDPTPIPHLPMALHVNVWPSRSKELAGRLVRRRLPTAIFIRSIKLEANRYRQLLTI